MISLILLAVLIGTIIDLIDIKKENSIKSADELNVNKKPGSIISNNLSFQLNFVSYQRGLS